MEGIRSLLQYSTIWASQVALVVKNSSADEGVVRDVGLIPGLRRSPGGQHGNPLQHSCLDNPMDRGAWQATVHGLAKSQIRLKRLSMHAACSNYILDCVSWVPRLTMLDLRTN